MQLSLASFFPHFIWPVVVVVVSNGHHQTTVFNTYVTLAEIEFNQHVALCGFFVQLLKNGHCQCLLNQENKGVPF